MTQKNIFFDIPDEHQVTILTEWLTFPNFGRFHSAVCKKSYQLELRKILNLKQCVFDYQSWSRYKCSTEWNVKNDVKLNGVNLSGPDLIETERRNAILGCYASQLTFVSIDLSKPNGKYTGDKKIAPSRELSFDLSAVFHELNTLCPNVKHLEMSQVKWRECLQPTDDMKCLHMYIQNSLVLESVQIDGFREISDSYVNALCAAPSLVKVAIKDCSLNFADEESNPKQSMTVCHLVASDIRLCARFPCLTELQLTGVTAAEIETIPALCPLLQNVTIQSRNADEKISRAGINTMCTHWRDIRTLNCKCGVTEQMVLVLLEQCPSLTNLSTTRTPITHTDVAVIGSGPQLRALNIYCEKASTLHEIIKLCPLLHILNLTQCKRPDGIVPDYVTVEQALDPVVSSRVIDFSLVGYKTMTDANILVLKNSQLEKLHICGIKKVTDTAIIALVPTLPSLHTLSLVDTDRIRNKVVMEVPRLCSTLRSFTYCQPNGCGCCGSTTSSSLFDELLPIVFPHVTRFDVDC